MCRNTEGYNLDFHYQGIISSIMPLTIISSYQGAIKVLVYSLSTIVSSFTLNSGQVLTFLLLLPSDHF